MKTYKEFVAEAEEIKKRCRKRKIEYDRFYEGKNS